MASGKIRVEVDLDGPWTPPWQRLLSWFCGSGLPQVKIEADTEAEALRVCSNLRAARDRTGARATLSKRGREVTVSPAGGDTDRREAGGRWQRVFAAFEKSDLLRKTIDCEDVCTAESGYVRMAAARDADGCETSVSRVGRRLFLSKDGPAPHGRWQGAVWDCHRLLPGGCLEIACDSPARAARVRNRACRAIDALGYDMRAFQRESSVYLVDASGARREAPAGGWGRWTAFCSELSATGGTAVLELDDRREAAGVREALACACRDGRFGKVAVIRDGREVFVISSPSEARFDEEPYPAARQRPPARDAGGIPDDVRCGPDDGAAPCGAEEVWSEDGWR